MPTEPDGLGHGYQDLAGGSEGNKLVCCGTEMRLISLGAHSCPEDFLLDSAIRRMAKRIKDYLPLTVVAALQAFDVTDSI